MSKQKKTSIGGQALIEGVMMRGPNKSAMAVRKPDGSIVVEDIEITSNLGKMKVLKSPFIRGIFNLVDSMRVGMRCILRSAELSLDGEEEEEEPSKFEKTMIKIFGEKFLSVLMGISSVMGVALAIFLFMYVPSILFNGFNSIIPADISYYRALFEGILKVILFLSYLKVVTLMKDIHRVFEYHGAEHKTIFCYEAGLELTPENVQKFKRFHPRCGTSFMFLMILIGIFLTTILTLIIDVSAMPVILWVLIKILLIPVLCGIGYEIIKFTGRHENTCTKIIAYPGLLVQRLTTFEPDEKEIEIAIAALKAVIPEDDSDNW